MSQGPNWVWGGLKRGTWADRQDDVSYASQIDAIIPINAVRSFQNSQEWRVAQAMNLPISIVEQPENGVASVTILFLDPNDDGIRHNNPVANAFCRSMGWGEFF